MTAMAKQPSPSTALRQLRVGELIRRTLSDVLNRSEIHDPDLNRMSISVGEVRLSNDLKVATVHIMPLGGKDIEPVLAALTKHKKFIRGEIAHRVNLKSAPEVRFLADESFDKGAYIDRLLKSPVVTRDTAKPDATED